MNRFFKKMLRGLSPSVWRLRHKLPFNWKELGRKTDEAISYRSFFIGQKYARKEFKAFCLLFSRTVVSDSLWPHGLQHTRPSCPSPSPKVCPSSCPFHPWCHPAILSSDALFSFCPQSFPALRTFPISWLFVSYDPNTVTSTLTSVLSGLISLKIDRFDLLSAQGTLRSLLQHHRSKTSVLWHFAFFMVQLSQLYMTTGNTITMK